MDYKNLYNQQLLEHYNHPKNKGTLQNPDMQSGVYNPSCGDSISVQAHIQNNTIAACKFEATGCVISCASASMVVDKVIGMSFDQARQLTKNDILKLVGIRLGPTRLRCALLALEALHNAIQDYQNNLSRK
jgi:nitrogen fixation NifU-like protein